MFKIVARQALTKVKYGSFNFYNALCNAAFFVQLVSHGVVYNYRRLYREAPFIQWRPEVVGPILPIRFVTYINVTEKSQRFGGWK